MALTEQKRLTLHLISDSTGNTLASAARATAVRFEFADFTTEENAFVRTREHISHIVEQITQPALILHTLSDVTLQDHLTNLAMQRGIEAVGVLDTTVQAMARHLGAPARSQPGQQHRVDHNYNERIAALDFAMAHDDGVDPDRLLAADVIVVGVSRSSKTPTCIYLGYQGVRAANVPLVLDVPAPPGLLAAMEAGVPVVGLVVSPGRLAQVTSADARSRKPPRPFWSNLESAHHDWDRSCLGFCCAIRDARTRRRGPQDRRVPRG